MNCLKKFSLNRVVISRLLKKLEESRKGTAVPESSEDLKWFVTFVTDYDKAQIVGLIKNYQS